MLNKYNEFINSKCTEYFGNLPINLNGSFYFSKNNNNIYMKILINLGYEVIKIEEFDNSNNIKKLLNNFINNYFTNINKYELEDMYALSENLINDNLNDIDEYSYENENIIEEYENTFLYDELLEKYPSEQKAIKNIFCKIYKYTLKKINY